MTKEQLMFEAEVYNKSLTNHPKSVQELTEVLAGFGERLQLLQQTPCNELLPQICNCVAHTDCECWYENKCSECGLPLR